MRQGPGLFRIPVDGGTPIRLVTGPAFDPVVSPDGNLIVYAGQQTAVAPLLAVRPDGSPVTLPPIRVRDWWGRPLALPAQRESGVHARSGRDP